MDQWIGMNKGVMDGKDVDRSVLEKIYKALRQVHLPNLMMAGPLGPRMGGTFTPRQPETPSLDRDLPAVLEIDVEGWMDLLDRNSVTARLDQFIRLESATIGEYTVSMRPGLSKIDRPKLNRLWAT